MKIVILSVAVLSLTGALGLPANADDVGQGKAPFMTEVETGTKFYAKNAHNMMVVKTKKSQAVKPLKKG